MFASLQEGWLTADGTLFIPAPEGSPRKEQIMVLGVDYFTSSALLAASIDKTCLDIVEEILGPNIELFGKGQILYKEPSGGHAKFMHQDSAYFEFAKDGPVGTLNYCIDTTLSLDNGPLHVVPGSHRLGYIDHIDTHSHLALDPKDWPFNKGIPIEGKAGDTIFFHVNTIHGSMHNKSNKPRPVFINRYLRPDDYQLLQATSVKMRTEAKAKLAAIGDKFPTKDRGYMVRGWREYDGLDWTLAVAHH
jgi:ectoine hydroxylase-related dioxygenase (phytanoyl-CoA dioxygenase family)